MLQHTSCWHVIACGSVQAEVAALRAELDAVNRTVASTAQTRQATNQNTASLQRECDVLRQEAVEAKAAEVRIGVLYTRLLCMCAH